MPVLKAETAVYGGYVISRAGGVVFIRGAIPGEVVDVSVREKKRDYSIAEVDEIVEPSEERIEPPCPYFGDCGGCQLQFASYDKQLLMKAGILRESMARLGSMEVEIGSTLAGADFNYRSRAQFKVSREGRIGFFREGTREVVPIAKCPIMVEEINAYMAKMTSDHIENVKEVHITAGADGLAVLLKGPDFDENLAERHVEIGASTVAFDNFSYRGQGFVTLGLGGLTYTVSPWSFFQSNWPMNIQSVETIANSLGELKGSRVLDLYAGGGNFSLMLSKNGAKVTAVEDNPHAVKDGERNALLNELKGVKFVRGRAENARAGGTFDVVILDPPRPGLTKAAMARILEWAPQKIVYVSCNPATFARDAKKLSRMYDLDSLRLVDFFPNTYHIESLAFLSKKAGQ